MPDCICLPGCPFFNDRMQGLETTKEMMKKNLCRGDFENCARYTVFKALGKGNVPPDLYPNQRDRALKIIGK